MHWCGNHGNLGTIRFAQSFLSAALPTLRATTEPLTAFGYRSTDLSRAHSALRAAALHVGFHRPRHWTTQATTPEVRRVSEFERAKHNRQLAAESVHLFAEYVSRGP